MELLNNQLDECFYLNGQISDHSVEGLVNQMKFAMRNGNGPLKLCINSSGGSVFAGMKLVDFITNSKIPIHTYADDKIHGMGAYIFMCGKERKMGDNATMIVVPITVGAACPNFMDEMSGQFRRIQEQLSNLFLVKSNVTQETLNNWLKDQVTLTHSDCVDMAIVC